MFEDWNKGVSCVGQLVQDVEVEMSRMMTVLKQITTKIVNGAAMIMNMSNVLLLFV